MLKSLLLITLLCCALLYGMELTKDNMIDMKGLDNSQDKTSLLDFNIPQLTSHSEETPVTTTQKSDQEVETPKKAKATSAEPSIEDRIQHLNDIETFNPFSELGDKVGQGVSGVFTKGIEVTASVFNSVINVFL